jgi:hypothetical protein
LKIALQQTTSDASASESSPLQLSWAVLVNETLVVGLEGLWIWELVALGVQVELIELLYPSEHLGVFGVLHPLVLAFLVPGVERVETDHVHTLLRDGAVVALEHVVHVLIVPVGHGNIIKTTTVLVDAFLRGVDRVVKVLVVLEEFWEHDFVGEFAPNREGIPDHAILRLAKAAQNLTEVVEQPNEVEPVVVGPFGADSLCCLEIVVGVGHVRVGVGVVDHRVQQLNDLPDRHLPLAEGSVLGELGFDEVVVLVLMVLPVELADGVLASGVLVIAEFLLLLVSIWNFLFCLVKQSLGRLAF